MPVVDVATGPSLFFESLGNGPPVLCIQGTGVVANGWRPQLEALSDEFE